MKKSFLMVLSFLLIISIVISSCVGPPAPIPTPTTPTPQPITTPAPPPTATTPAQPTTPTTPTQPTPAAPPITTPPTPVPTPAPTTLKPLPPFTMAVDDNAPATDVILISNTANDIDNLGKYNKIPTTSTKLFSQVNALNIDKMVTLAIYKGEAVIIVGATSPAQHVIFANDIKIILDGKSITNRIILSSSVKTANLIDLFITSICTSTYDLNLGQKKLYTFSGKDYDVEVIYLDPNSVQFTINGEITSKVAKGSSYTLVDGSKVTAANINAANNKASFCIS